MASYVKMAHSRHLSIEVTLPPGTRNILAEHFNKHCQWPWKHLKIGGIILRGHFLPSSKRGHFLKLKRILLCLLQNVPPMPPVPTSMKPLCVYFLTFHINWLLSLYFFLHHSVLMFINTRDAQYFWQLCMRYYQTLCEIVIFWHTLDLNEILINHRKFFIWDW